MKKHGRKQSKARSKKPRKQKTPPKDAVEVPSILGAIHSEIEMAYAELNRWRTIWREAIDPLAKTSKYPELLDDIEERLRGEVELPPEEPDFDNCQSAGCNNLRTAGTGFCDDCYEQPAEESE